MPYRCIYVYICKSCQAQKTRDKNKGACRAGQLSNEHSQHNIQKKPGKAHDARNMTSPPCTTAVLSLSSMLLNWLKLV